jgi:hypothetical protein
MQKPKRFNHWTVKVADALLLAVIGVFCFVDWQPNWLGIASAILGPLCFYFAFDAIYKLIKAGRRSAHS